MGIELDGATARVVEIDDREIIWYGTFEGANAADAVSRWQESRPSRFREASVAWAGPGNCFRQLDVPEIPASALGEYLAVSLADQLPLPPDHYVMAAAAAGGWRGGPQTASVVVTESSRLGSAWPLIHDLPAGVTPAEFTLSTDGLHLAARNSCAVLMLRYGGVPVAVRELACGGSDAFASRLSGRRQPTQADAEIVDAYAAALAEEVRVTAEYWRNQGHTVPSQLQVQGPNASLPRLGEVLFDAGFETTKVPIPSGIDFPHSIAERELVTYHGALSAALSAPNLDVAVRNPHAQRTREAVAQRRVRRLASIAIVGALVLFAAWAAVPYYLSRINVADARGSHRSAVAERASLEDINALSSQIITLGDSLSALHVGEPNWSALLGPLLDTAPPGSDFETLSLVPQACPSVAPSAVEEPGTEYEFGPPIDDSEGQSDPQPDFGPPIDDTGSSAGPGSPLDVGPSLPSSGVDTTTPGWMCIGVTFDTSLPAQDLFLVSRWIAELERTYRFDVLPSTLIIAEKKEQRAVLPFDVSFTMRVPNEAPYRTPRTPYEDAS